MRNIQKFCLEVAKTTFKWVKWRKSKNQILLFWAIFDLWEYIFFQERLCKLLKTIVFIN